MRIRSYWTNNFKLRKGRTLLCLLGVILSTVNLMVIMIVADRYTLITQGFFTPFASYDQIVEQGTNYFQMVPAGSLIDENDTPIAQNILGATSIPCLLVENDQTVGSFNFYYYFGLNITDIPLLWSKIGLQSGRWPENTSEIIIGQSQSAPNGTINIGNRSFTVVGVLNNCNSYLNGGICLDLNYLQIFSQLEGKVSLIFVDNSQPISNSRITSFENQVPNVNYLTSSDLNAIQGSLAAFASNISSIFTFLALASSLIFIFTIQTLSLISRKQDLILFRTIGIGQKQLFGMCWMELAILFFFGSLIGIPLSFITYIIIFSILQMGLGLWANWMAAIKNNTILLFTYFPIANFFTYFIIFLGFGLLLACIPPIIGFRISQKYSESKVRY